MGIFDFFKKKKEKPKDKDKVKDIEMSAQKSITKNDFEAQRRGYHELGQICLNESKQLEYSKFIASLTDYQDNEEYMTTLNYVIDCLNQKGNYFIICLDWKQEITSLTHGVNHTLCKNFNIQIELPQQNDYGQRASVAYDNVLQDFDKAINKIGFQLSFIDTNTDQYIIVVHKIKDLEKAKGAIRRIGYDCLNSSSKKIRG